MQMRKQLGLFLIFLGLGMAGALVFEALSLPAGYLAGPMVMIVLVRSLKIKLPSAQHYQFPAAVSSINYILIGAAMGSSVAPGFWSDAALWPVSILGLTMVVGAITAAVFLYVVRVCGWSRDEAFFAGLPGALTMTTALAQERNAPMERIMVVQLVRLFLLIAILPLVISTIVGGAGQEQVSPAFAGANGEVQDVLQVLLALGICAAAAWSAQKLKAPAALLTGAFFASAALNSSGLLVFHLPSWLAIICYITLGTSVGLYIGKLEAKALKPMIGTSLMVFAISLSVALIGALLVSWILSISFSKVFLAFAPGGMEAILLISVLLDIDPVFVATHQLARFMGLLAFLPIITRLVLGPVPSKLRKIDDVA